MAKFLLLMMVLWWVGCGLRAEAGNLIVDSGEKVINRSTGNAETNSGVELGGRGCRNMVTGNGKRETRLEELPPLRRLKLTGLFRLTVIYCAGKRPRLQITGDGNLLSRVRPVFHDGLLEVSFPPSYRTETPVALTLYTAHCNDIALAGSGRAVIKGVDSGQFKLKVSGAVVVELSGESTILSLSAGGVSKINAAALHCSQATVKADGAATVIVHVTGELRVAATGAAQISYIGRPAAVRQKLSGAARLTAACRR